MSAPTTDTDFDAEAGGYVYVFTVSRAMFMTGEIKAAQLMRDRVETIARNATREEGKTLAETRIETLSGANLLDFYAEEARRTYGRVLVRPAMALGRFLWKRGDGWLIDGYGPDGVSARVIDVTRNVVRLQTGYLYHYAFVMLIGIAALLTWAIAAGGLI